MNNWKYWELKDFIKETYNVSLSYGLNPVQSIERCLYEFGSVMKDGYCETVIVCSILGMLAVSNSIILSDHQYGIIAPTLMDFSRKNVEPKLAEDEISDLVNCVNQAGRILRK